MKSMSYLVENRPFKIFRTVNTQSKYLVYGKGVLYCLSVLCVVYLQQPAVLYLRREMIPYDDFSDRSIRFDFSDSIHI